MSVWYCYLCEKSIHYRGVPRHRQMHRDRGDVVNMSNGRYRYEYDFRGQETALTEKNA